MFTLRLPSALEKRLNQLVQKTHRTKSYYIKLALEDFLDEQEDLLIAEYRWQQVQQGKHKLIPLEDVIRKLEQRQSSKLDH